ncbi:helix-turn-helix domain-containing protein, partial [Clostridium sp. D5]
MKKTHLSLEDRITISQMLSEQQSFKQIATAVGKNCTSISREIRNH